MTSIKKRLLLGFVLTASLQVMSRLPATAMSVINTTPTTAAHDLNLDGEGSASTRIVHVADITISTDNPSGLTLTITSGEITKVGGESIAFQVTTVPHNAAAPSPGDFVTAPGADYTYSTTSATSEARDVYIRYTSQALQDPGHYSAIINLWVIDN